MRRSARCAALPSDASAGSSPAPNVEPTAPATMTTLIMTAKLNDIDPQAWLADVLARINDHASHRLDELQPWNWCKPVPSHAAS